MLKCTECKDGESSAESIARFCSLNDLEAHLVEEHFSNCCIYECPICQYTRFPTEFSLVQHCREFHRDLGKIQLKQSVDLAKLDSRSQIHSSLNNSVFELTNKCHAAIASDRPTQSHYSAVTTPKILTEKIQKVTPAVCSSITGQNCTIFHSITPTSLASTSKKVLPTLQVSASGNDCIELQEIPQFTTRTSQQGGIILISPTGYEYRKSKKVANSRGEYIYRCNSMLGYRDCRARVAVEICTGIGTLKDKQHSHPPPAIFHQNVISTPQSVAEMFLSGRKSKRGRHSIKPISSDYYDEHGYTNYEDEEDSLEHAAKREDIKDEDVNPNIEPHPNISSVNDFIFSIAQQK